MGRPNTSAIQALIVSEVEAESVTWEAAIYRTLALLTLSVAALVCVLWSKVGARSSTLNLAVSGVAAGYFTGCWLLVRRSSSAILPLLRVVSTVVEASLGSLALYSISLGHGGAWAQSSPALFIYALAILIAAARMRPLLCLCSTVAIAIQYPLLYHLVLGPATSPDLQTAVPTFQAWAMWNRVFWLVLIGLVATITTHRARKLLISTGTSAFERRRIEHEFGRYVSRDVAEKILHGDVPMDHAERRTVTVLFCDLRDFTAICERVRPEEVVAMLNTFYERLCAIIETHGGTVNKFLGDGVLALFGAPAEHRDHARAAADVALEILRVADGLRAQRGVWESFDVGIGLDTGVVVVGAIGAPSRVEYTAIGSTVNRAARLQGLARGAGQRVIVSRACAEALGGGVALVSLGDVTLKGFAAPEAAFAFGAPFAVAS